jgi:hypothetical protein
MSIGKADREHLTYVSKQVCTHLLFYGRAGASPYEPEGAKFYTQRSDAHHLPSPFGERRRTCDWFTVPLARRRHNWIDTEEGRRWEKRSYLYLLRHALFLCWKNRRADLPCDPYEYEPDNPMIIRFAEHARLAYDSDRPMTQTDWTFRPHQ